VRSQTKVTADVLERADALKVVARAGIGLDNVDVDAATRRGIMVVNAPQSNILSAAEHTMALILAQARNIPAAHAALRAGSGEREIALMKDGVRIVNTSRGGIVSEKALVAAVRDGKVAGAALDVFEQEPIPRAHPLLVYDNVVLTPHLGASTKEAQDKAGTAI